MIPPFSMSPEDLAIDSQGLLLVSDDVHHRILMYQPVDYCKGLKDTNKNECHEWFNELANVYASWLDMTPAPYKNGQTPSGVIGQPSFTSTSANAGGGSKASERSLYFPGGLAFDPQGNLWVADAGRTVY